jgi:nitrate/nitrite transporter NarK
MGIAGAGNSGTLLATVFAPRLARAFGWHTVFGLAMVPITLVWVLFFVMAKDGPGARKVKRWADYAALLKEPDTAWFCFIYMLTFGGFVGLASYLSIFFHDQYGVTPVRAGDLTTVVVLFGSFLRPIGGLLADRWGGYRMLLFLLAGISVCLAGIATLPAVQVALMLLILTMAMLGMGNGSVFQLVPQRFPTQVGIITGIVGAAGPDCWRPRRSNSPAIRSVAQTIDLCGRCCIRPAISWTQDAVPRLCLCHSHSAPQPSFRRHGNNYDRARDRRLNRDFQRDQRRSAAAASI